MHRIHLGLFVLLTLLPFRISMAIEEAKYEIITSDDNIEIRQYAPAIVAEIVVTGDIESAGDEAFRPLFNYISGDNTARQDIAMTAPVSQQTAGESIAMTAPVNQQAEGEQWLVSFMMPASYTLDTLPVPNDNRIQLRQLPPRLIAAIRYSGFWSESNYLSNKTKLEKWLQQTDYQISGEAIWARYNAPFTPWFLRRNEVLLPLVINDTPRSK